MSLFISFTQGFLSISDFISPLPPNKKRKQLYEISSSSVSEIKCFICMFSISDAILIPDVQDILTVERKKHLDWKSVVGDNQILVKVITEQLILIKCKFTKAI